MIRVKHTTGNDLYNTEGLIRYLTVWMKLMGTLGSVRFYDGPVDLIADFRIGDAPDEILMISYPHCDKKNMIVVAEEKEARIRELLLNARLNEPNREVFTLNLSGEPRLVIREDFKRYSAIAEPQTELFFFDNTDPTTGFPNLCIFEKHQATGAYGPVFRVLAKASRYVFPVIDIPTPDGIRFTYMLTNSFTQYEFMPEVPNMSGVHFPTKHKCDIPPFLDTDEFDKFLVRIGMDKIVFKNGKIVKQEPDPKGLDVVDADDEVDLPLFMLDNLMLDEPNDKLKEQILQQITDKSSVNLGDAWVFGLENLLSLVPISNKVIEINTDMPGLVQRMCIHQGVYHVIPLTFEKNDDLADFLDLSEQVVKVCTVETYPRNTPLLPPGSELVG
jgi:hypothetical protein